MLTFIPVVIRRVQVNQHQLLVYADDVNILGGSVIL